MPPPYYPPGNVPPETMQQCAPPHMIMSQHPTHTFNPAENVVYPQQVPGPFSTFHLSRQLTREEFNSLKELIGNLSPERRALLDKLLFSFETLAYEHAYNQQLLARLQSLPMQLALGENAQAPNANLTPPQLQPAIPTFYNPQILPPQPDQPPTQNYPPMHTTQQIPQEFRNPTIRPNLIKNNAQPKRPRFEKGPLFLDKDVSKYLYISVSV